MTENAIFFIRNLLWGRPTVIFLFSLGFYFLIKLRFYPIFGFFDMIKSFTSCLKRKNGDITPLSSFFVSVGGTVGIGSIAGVGVSLIEGGPGSIFWLWAISITVSCIKYAEVYIGVSHTKEYANGSHKNFHGGAMYALCDIGKPKTAVFFCVTAILCAITVGCVTQSNAVGKTFIESGFPSLPSALIFATCVAISISGGKKQIAVIEKFAVPISSFLYLILVFYLLIARFSSIPSAFLKIISSSLGTNEFVSGALGYTVSKTVSTGVTRGIFSTEVGMGSSAISYSASDTNSPHEKAVFGIIETACDSFLFTTPTAIVLIIYGETNILGVFNEGLGALGFIFIPIIFIFAMSSVISWCFYAEECIFFLAKNKKIYYVLFRTVIVFTSFFAYTFDNSISFAVSDIFAFTMMIPNITLLILQREEIFLCLKNKKYRKRRV